MGAVKQQMIRDGHFDNDQDQYIPEEPVMPVSFEGLTKTEIAANADNVVNSVMEHGNVLVIAEALSAMEEFVKQVRNDPRLVEYVREELVKNNGKMSTASGAKIELCETGTSYDYSLNQNWCDLNNQIEELTEKRKALEDKLKKIPAGLALVDPESGDMLFGPAKSSKSSYKLTLKK